MDKQKIAQAMAADVCHSLVNTDPVWLDQADPAAIALAVADNLIQQDAICAAGSNHRRSLDPTGSGISAGNAGRQAPPLR